MTRAETKKLIKRLERAYVCCDEPHTKTKEVLATATEPRAMVRERTDTGATSESRRWLCYEICR